MKRNPKARAAGLGLALALLTAPAAPGSAQDTSEHAHTWRGELAPGSVLAVRTFGGSVQVRRAEGRTAEVHFTARGDDPGRVHFSFREDGNTASLCASPDPGERCGPGARGWGARLRNVRNLRADAVVLLPAGVEIQARTGNGTVTIEEAGADVVAASGNGRVRVLGAGGHVRASSGNGAVTVRDAAGPVDASSGNGSIQVSAAAGPVSARTGNGPITVRMASLAEAGDMRLSTGNGSIELWVPESFGARVEARGRRVVVRELAVSGHERAGRGRERLSLGDGAARVRLSTGNGTITMRRTQ
jgi:hypothetical protein